MKLNNQITLLLSITFILIGCSNNDKEDDSIIEKERLTVPKLTTEVLSDITFNSAKSGGNITDDGGANVIARGVCWGENINPTLNNNFSNDGTDIGTFISAISELEENTQYYLRAYATNSEGTSYGNEVVFITVEEPRVIFEGDVYLESQKEVDDFGALGYTQINGFLRIGTGQTYSIVTTDITDISVLSDLVQITKGLAIIHNPLLENIDGLNNLELIGENQQNGRLQVFIGYNDNLSEISGFKKLGVVKGEFVISGNDSLEKISGFNNLITVSNDLIISYNNELSDLSGFDSLSILGGDLTIFSTNLKDTSSIFDSLESIGGTFKISGNNSLEGISNFNSLKTIVGDLEIEFNNNLLKISGFSELSSIDGSLRIRNDRARTRTLNEIIGFEKLTSIGASLNINGNPFLTIFTAFSNLESVGNSFQIIGSIEIVNLDNFENLKMIGERLFIAENSKLSDFCALTTASELGYSESYLVYDNLFNPTQQELIDGNCKN